MSLLQTTSPSHDATHLGPRCTPPMPYVTAASLCSQGGNGSRFWTTTTQQRGTNMPPRCHVTAPPRRHITAPPCRRAAMSQHHQPACEPLLAGVDGGADDHGGTTNKNTNREDDREKTTTTAKTGGWRQGGDDERQRGDDNAGMTDDNARTTNDNAGTTNDGADHNEYLGRRTTPCSRYKRESVGSFFFFFSFFRCDGRTL